MCRHTPYRWLAALSGVVLAGQTAGAETRQAVSAKDFTDTLGVGTHIVYKDGAYANVVAVATDLKFLGISNVRDNVLSHLGPDTASPNDYLTLADAGAKFDLAVSYALPNGQGKTFVDQTIAMLDLLQQRMPHSIVAVEGLNEINNWPIGTYKDQTGVNAALASQRDLYAAVHVDPKLRGVQVYDLTGAPTQPSFAGRADFGNQHPYPHNALQPQAWIAQGFTEAYSMSGAYPKVVTETGNFSLAPGWPVGKPLWEGGALLGVDEPTQAKSILNTYFEAFLQGVHRTYVYELLDEKPDPSGAVTSMHYGLFHFDNSPKPAAAAIRNLTTILADRAAKSSAGQLDYALTGLPATARSLLLQKADGNFVLALWNDVPFWTWNAQVSQAVDSPAVPVRLSLMRQAKAIQVFDPLMSASPVQAVQDTSELALGIKDHPILVAITLAARSGAGDRPGEAGQAVHDQDRRRR